MLNDVPEPSTSKSAEKHSQSENKRRKKGKVHHQHNVKTSTVSQNPENNTVQPDPSPLSDLLTTSPPLAASTPSSNTASHDVGQPQSGPVRLTNLPEGYGGFYRATVTPNGKEIIIPVFGSPQRTAKDHSYCTQKHIKLPDMAQKKLGEPKDHDAPSPVCPSQSLPLPTPDMDQEDSDGYQSEIVDSDCCEMDDDMVNIKDSDYVPSTESSDSESEYEVETEERKYRANIYDQDTYADELKQEKFIVFEDNLRELLRFCMRCGSPITKCEKGKLSCVSYSIECHNGCHYTWKSQPSCSSLLIASSIFTTGNTYSKLSSFARALNLNFIGKTIIRTINVIT